MQKNNIELVRLVPRVYCVTDPEARVAAIFEKRSGKWWRISRWDLSAGTYQNGAWFQGSLYPTRADLSPGGRWLSYFALKYQPRLWAAGATYNAVSRLPWLKALAAWRESGTYSYGYHFVSDRAVWDVGNPTVGNAAPCRKVFGMTFIQPAQFSNERRRGWSESVSTPPRDPGDMWD